MQSIQVPQNVEFTFASTPTMIAHFPLNGNGNDTRGDLQLIRGPGDADPQSLQFQSGAPEVTSSSEHLFVPDQPNQFVSVRRQDDEEFVTFDESLSVSFWFRPESGGTVLSIRQARASAADQLQIVKLEYVPDNTINNADDGPITFVVGAERHVVPSTFSPLEDGWFHAAFVINPFLSGEEAVALFINGRRVLRGVLPSSLQGDEDALLRFLDIRLGADHDGGNRFRGGISDLRFESIYLTGVQVAQQLLPEGAELPSHTVIFDPNGATSGTSPLPVNYLQGSDVVFPGPGNLLKTGAIFAGWSTVPTASDDERSQPVQVLGPLTLYAQWAPSLYPFTSFTFTNGTQTGRTGPSLANLLSAYDTQANPWLGDTDFFDVANGIQIWTVPQTGRYRITATGAQGFSADAGQVGGAGAVLRGEFSLEQGQKLRILVGQEGSGVIGGSGGGGGGTFVTLLNGPIEDTEEEDILMIAGGGGGTRTDVLQNGCPGRTSELGGTGSGSSQTHNCGEKTSGRGEGGVVSSGSWGSGGGGFVTAGASDVPADFESGQAFIDGGVGGSSLQQPSNGGFGGGGSGEGRRGGGGGGGFSGGDGGRIAGGGGSFVGSSASNVVKTNSPGNSGHGSVMITRLHGDD